MSDAPDNNELIERPLVSIVLPIYNAGEYLRPCLDTLVNQTLREIEIICVLDCPTDGSDKVVEEYAAKDNRIVVIRNEQNLNIGESRNVGLRAAKGEYIGFSDHDDTRELDMYEKMYVATENGKKKIVFSGEIVEYVLNHEFPAYLDNTTLELINQLPLYQQLFYALIPRGGRPHRMHITPNLYSHHFITQHNLYFVDNKYYCSEDMLFLLSALAVVQSDDDISLLNHRYYLYWLHPTSTTLSNWYFNQTRILNRQYYIYNLAKKIKWINSIIYTSTFSVWQISLFYTLFTQNIKSIGYRKAQLSYKNLLNSSIILKEIVSSIPLGNRGLTLAKRLFLLWSKMISK